MKIRKMYFLLVMVMSVILLFNTVVCAADASDTDTKPRYEPLLNQLVQMDAATVEVNINRFSDMDKHWSRRVVGKLTGLGIIAGANGRFIPDNPVQIDQFLKMCICAMGYKFEQNTGYWAQPYIDAALNEELIVKGEFPDYTKMLTREQMAKIIVTTTLKVDAKPDNQNEQYIISHISDFINIQSEYKQYVLNAYKLGLTVGSNNKFNPTDTLTRAEAAAVIIRFLDVSERKPMKPESEEDRFPWEINYPSDEELVKLYKNPAIPERLYTRLADSDEGEIDILKSHHKFLCRSGEKEAEEWADFAKSYIETLNNIDYRNVQTDFKNNMTKVLSTTGTFNYNGKSNLTSKAYIEEYVKFFTENTIIQEAKFVTDPSLVYYGGQYGYYRVRGILYFKFSEPSNQKWMWSGSKVGEWYQLDMEMDFFYKITNERAFKKGIYLGNAKLLEDNIDV